MKPALILFLKTGAIAGNLLFILWVSFNAINEQFPGTVYQKTSYGALMALLITNCYLLIRSFNVETRLI